MAKPVDTPLGDVQEVSGRTSGGIRHEGTACRRLRTLAENDWLGSDRQPARATAFLQSSFRATFPRLHAVVGIPADRWRGATTRWAIPWANPCVHCVSRRRLAYGPDSACDRDQHFRLDAQPARNKSIHALAAWSDRRTTTIGGVSRGSLQTLGHLEAKAKSHPRGLELRAPG